MSFDTDWFGDCSNTFHEEQKQIAYAKRMGLLPLWGGAHPPTFDLDGATVADIGGGPVSILLKCAVRGSGSTVIDPGEYPWWVRLRYEMSGIEYWQMRGEDIPTKGAGFDEAWIYNVLQHVHDPAKVCGKARAIARIVRVFEWVDIPSYEGHPNLLTKDGLEEWLGGTGFVANVDELGAVGKAFYGVFRGSPSSG